MSDLKATDEKLEYEKIKTLFDYTKYHITVYTTLGTALLGAIGAKADWKFNRPLMWIAVILIGIAGLAGGTIASTLPECSSVTQFQQMRFGPWNYRLFSGNMWARIEHTSFWLALIAGAVSVYVAA